jgi:hypothetical protein
MRAARFDTSDAAIDALLADIRPGDVVMSRDPTACGGPHRRGIESTVTKA